jgi:hypothetical protein
MQDPNRNDKTEMLITLTSSYILNTYVLYPINVYNDFMLIRNKISNSI